EELLASCYRTALALAAEQSLSSIAFPAISTGVYRFPPERAARIAVGTVVAEIAHEPRGITRVVFCCFSPDSAEHHRDAFADLGLWGWERDRFPVSNPGKPLGSPTARWPGRAGARQPPAPQNASWPGFWPGAPGRGVAMLR